MLSGHSWREVTISNSPAVAIFCPVKHGSESPFSRDGYLPMAAGGPAHPSQITCFFYLIDMRGKDA
jgi:hypothetical protein